MVSFIRSLQDNFACKNSEKFAKYSQSYGIMCQLAFEVSLTWGWYMLSALTLCSGIRTFIKKCLCSSLSGSAKPLIILQIEKRRTSKFKFEEKRSPKEASPTSPVQGDNTVDASEDVFWSVQS